MHVAPGRLVNDNDNENETENNDSVELTPVCDPPLRGTDAPIGSSWWIEPSHPEIDPATSLLPVPDKPSRG